MNTLALVSTIQRTVMGENMTDEMWEDEGLGTSNNNHLPPRHHFKPCVMA
jgi:hypothetical protein